MEVTVLTKSEISEMMRQVARMAVSDLRDDIEKNKIREVMTKSQLAEYLSCDVSKIDRYMKKGLPYHQFGEHPRFYRTEIDAWIKSDNNSDLNTIL